MQSRYVICTAHIPPYNLQFNLVQHSRRENYIIWIWNSGTRWCIIIIIVYDTFENQNGRVLLKSSLLEPSRPPLQVHTAGNRLNAVGNVVKIVLNKIRVSIKVSNIFFFFWKCSVFSFTFLRHMSYYHYELYSYFIVFIVSVLNSCDFCNFVSLFFSLFSQRSLFISLPNIKCFVYPYLYIFFFLTNTT